MLSTPCHHHRFVLDAWDRYAVHSTLQVDMYNT